MEQTNEQLSSYEPKSETSILLVEKLYAYSKFNLKVLNKCYLEFGQFEYVLGTYAFL